MPALFLAITLAATPIVYLGTRHHPIVHQRYVSVVVPLAFALASGLLLAFVVRRQLTPGPMLLAVDLAAWVPLLAMVADARRGYGHVLLWLGIALCVKAAALLLALLRAVAQARVGERVASWLLVAIAVVFYVAPLPLVRLDRGLQLKGDEPHYLVSTISLLRDHDLYVEDEYAAHVYAPFYDQTLDPHAVPARDGHLASFHDAGLAILATVPYAVGGWIAVVLAMALVAGLAVREMFLLARIAGADPLASLLATVFLGFSLPFAVFSTQIYPEVPGAFLTVAATRRLLGRAGGSGSGPLVTGIALGLLPLLQLRFWAIVVPLLVAAMVTWRGMRQRTRLLGPLVVLTLGYVALNAAVYGRLTISPFLFHESITAGLGTRVAAAGGPLGVLLDAVRPWFDPYDGLLWISPVTILAVVAIPMTLRRSGFVVRAALAALVLYSFVVGLHYLISTSGDSPPGRFLVAVVSLLVVPLATILREPFRRLTLPIAGIFAAGGAVTLLISLADPLLARYPFLGRGGPVAIIGQRLHLPLQQVLPSFPQPTASALLKTAVVLATLAVAAFWLDRATDGRWQNSSKDHPYNGTRADLPG